MIVWNKSSLQSLPKKVMIKSWNVNEKNSQETGGVEEETPVIHSQPVALGRHGASAGSR